MQQYVGKYLRHFSPSISEESIDLLLSDATEKHFKKGNIIVNKGDISRYFYILKTGVARDYIIDENGKEHIKTLYTPPSTLGSLAGLIKHEASETVYDCITDCTVIEINYYKLQENACKNIELSQLNKKVLEMIFIRSNERINDLTILDATERYLKLKKNIPNIENLIAQYHIASFLNVTPVQLSRIRKKLFSQ